MSEPEVLPRVTPAPSESGPEPRAPALPRLSVPALSVMPPVKVFAVARVSDCEPFFTIPVAPPIEPVPEIVYASVLLSTVIDTGVTAATRSMVVGPVAVSSKITLSVWPGPAWM